MSLENMETNIRKVSTDILASAEAKIKNFLEKTKEKHASILKRKEELVADPTNPTIDMDTVTDFINETILMIEKAKKLFYVNAGKMLYEGEHTEVLGSCLQWKEKAAEVEKLQSLLVDIVKLSKDIIVMSREIISILNQVGDEGQNDE